MGSTNGSSCTATSPFVSGFGYNPGFQVSGFNYGNGVAASFGYSADRLQLTSLTYTKSPATLLSLTYGYTQNGGNNGQITSITDNTGTQEAGRSVTNTYDALYRLTQAVTTGSANYPQWGLSFTYDRYGNRTGQSISSGCVPPMTCPTNSLSFANPGGAQTNQPDGMCFDANGNLAAESGTCPPGTPTYRWDAENRLVNYNGSSATYTYDGNGFRVMKSSGSTTTVYLFLGSKVIAEYDNNAAPSSPTREYIYSGTGLLAKIEAGATTYYHPDHLSNRVLTDSSGNILGQRGQYPFGETWYETGTTTKLNFTSYERDGESTNDYAIARSYINRFGRFSSPDPLAGYAANPQSLNRYSYGVNDPENLIDPLGLQTCELGYYVYLVWDAEALDLYYVWCDFGASHGGGGTALDVNGRGPGQKKKKNKAKEDKDCFAKLKFNSNPAQYGAPPGTTHSFWYVQDRSQNQYIVSAGPTNEKGGMANMGALNVWGASTPVAPANINSGSSKASDTTSWQTGSSPKNCDAVDKLLAAARAFPNNTFKYNPVWGPNSNTAAALLGQAAGFKVTPPPGSWGWNAPLPPPGVPYP